MRGDDEICGRLFSYIDLEKRVRLDHPLRLIRQIVNAALKALSGEFDKLYSPIGRKARAERHRIAQWQVSSRLKRSGCWPELPTASTQTGRGHRPGTDGS
jgi:hypothetical protein